jgi:NhaA family Na+:H+ antiporter
MANSVPVGIMAGLFFGKQIGVFVLSWISIKLGLAKLPEGSRWSQLYGVSVLTGIGFTMSLFVDSLAFKDDTLFQHADRLAILLASFASGLFGYLMLKFSRGCTIKN